MPTSSLGTAATTCSKATGGADVLHGGAGQDTASYRHSHAGVKVNLATAAVGGGHAQGDTLRSIEHLVGSRHVDTLFGDDGDNALHGLDGNDRLFGSGGQ